jgi:hypothetical protein
MNSASRVALALVLTLSPMFGQTQTITQTTTINLGTQGRNPDFSGEPFTRPMTVGTALPPTCQIGQMFFNSAAAAGANLYGCTAVNVWTLEGGSGTGGSGGTPVASLSSATISFGNQSTGTTSASQSVTLSNTGTAALSIGSITITGANASDFAQTNNCGSSLTSGSSCTINATFTPSVAASESASISVADGASDSPQLVALSGTGNSSGSSANPAITPAALVAGVGTPVNVTSNRAVTWSLAPGSAGSLSGQTGTSVTYIPPSSIKAQNSIGGCMVLPNDSVFNTQVDNLPVNSNSASWVNAMGTNWIIPGYTWGINIIDNTLPGTPQTFYYSRQQNGTSYQIAAWPNRKRETGALTTDYNNDHHMVSLNRQTCHFYETYADEQVTETRPWTATSGWHYSSTSYAQPSTDDGGGTTDAAGLPLEPLTLHLSEIRAGAVNHALRFTLCTGCINNATFLWPATGANGSPTPSAPPMGARFRLKQSYSITGVYNTYVEANGSGYTSAPTVTFSGCQTAPTGTAVVSGGAVQSITLTSMGANCTNPTITFGGPGTGARATAYTFPSAAQVVLKALQQYGMILTDNGGSGQVQVSTDITEDPTVAAAVSVIGNARIVPSNFEAVDESPLMLSQTLHAVNPSNGYVTPSSYATLIATDSNDNKTTMPIALQPVLVGVPYETMTVAAGMSGYQLQSWVNGSSNQSVTWALVSGPGSVTAGGVYTPPASISSPTQAVLTATAAADSNATATVAIEVLPAGTNPTNSIRIDIGSSSSYTDSQGNVWQPDVASSEMGSYVTVNDSYPTGIWGSVADATLYSTYKYTYGDDMYFGPYIVPNGNYKVGLHIAHGDCAGSYSVGPFNNGLINGQMELESQGQIGAWFDLGKAVNYACRTPYTAYIPAQVTNNLLYVNVRATGGNNTHSVPWLNALSIIPDSTMAHLAIDTQQVSTITAGSTAQLYAVGWYMSNAVTWSVSGGGSIDQNGLYTAPATAPASDQIVTITATSTATPSISATATLTLKSGS